MTGPRLCLVAYLLAALCIPVPGNAFIDCCFVNPDHIELRKVTLPGMDADQFEAWGRRLGFDVEYRVEDRAGVVPFIEVGDLDVTWQVNPIPSDLGLGAPSIAPGVQVIMAYACPGYPRPVRRQRVVHAHPNGAIHVSGFFADAPDAAPVAHVLGQLNVGLHDVVSYGCSRSRSDSSSTCEWEVDDKFLRVRVPDDARDLVHGLVPDQQGAWRGMVIEVSDLSLTRRALRSQGTPFVERADAWSRVLRVEPEREGGPIVEFVSSPGRS